MKRYLATALVLAGIVLAVWPTGRSMATPTTVVVSPGTLVAPSAPDGWYFWNDKDDTPTGSPGALVGGPATPPAGAGSVELGPLTDSGTTGGGHSVIATNRYFGTPLASITSLSYSSYQPGPTLAVALQFDVRYRTTDTAYGGRLVFEPYQNGAVTVGSGWQSWSPLAGTWWASKTDANGTGGAQVAPLPAGNCAIATPCTWAEINAAFPAAAVYGRFLLKAGSGAGWVGFDGNADNLLVGISGVEMLFDFEGDCTTDCYVRPDGNDANTGLADAPGQAKLTVQAAVNQVSTGGTVHVGAGTYVEQVDIGKQLTLDGAGAGSTIIQAPASLATMFTTSTANKPVVYVHASGGTISNLTVDGNGVGNANYRFEGVAFYNAGGTVTNSEIVAVRDTPISGNQHGVALYAYNTDSVARTLTVTNNTISDYQKNGMALNGAGLTATVSGNVVTGAGAFNSQAQNGIQIGFGAVGSITGNTVSGNQCTVIADCTADPTSATNADGAAGILLYTPGAGTITVTNNTLTGNQFGVWTVGATSLDVGGNTISGVGGTGVAVWDCDQWCGPTDAVGTTGTITNNTISGQAYGLLVRDFVAGAPSPSMAAHGNSITGSTSFGVWANAATNATDNWWGSANGAQHASNTFNVGSQGDKASDNVTFVPWLDAAPPAGVSFAPVTTTSPAGGYSSIQAGVNASSSGGTVTAAAGTFTENVTIATPLTLAGAGQASTTVIPAVSIPNPCAGSSLCGSATAASNIVLVQASNVTIHDLTLDGDNPSLTSAYNVGGANLDARNGIVENYYAGVFNNTTVHDVTVRNIYLRGIYMSSGGSGFNVHHNTVENVQAEYASIGIFNWVGAGTIANNTVSYANDAISANHSSGTQFLNNVVTHSGSGVHTDNAGDGGGAADLIDGNTVSDCAMDGYGVWTFSQYLQPTVKRNVITGCAVGMAATGSYVGQSTLFQDNEVDGTGALVSAGGSAGLYITTQVWGFGSANVAATLTGNVFKNNTDGVFYQSDFGYTLTVDNTGNAIYDNSGTGASKDGTGAFNIKMLGDWWGSDSGPANATSNPGGTGNSVADGIAFSPWLGIGTDASGAAGFQQASPMTWIAGPAVCDGTCIQKAIDFSSNGDTVKATSGVFNEHVTLNKAITLTAGSNPIIDGGGSGDGITVTVPNATVSSFEVRNVTNGIVVAAGANNATVSSNNVHNFTSAAIRGNSATGLSASSNTIDGGHTGSCIGGFWGIQVANVSGTIDGNTVSGIGNGLTTGCQEGRAIEADGAGTINITNNVVGTYQKSGIIVRDTVNSVISGDTTAGEGPTAAIAQNGITVTSTGTATISGNHTSGHAYTPATVVSCGILTFASATVSGNDSTNDQDGICVAGGTGTQVTNNTVTGHRQQGILVDGAAAALIDGNTIDGQGNGTTASPGTDPDTDTRYYGVFAVDSTGTISNNTITAIRHGVGSGLQSGAGIRLSARSGASADMTISGNTLTDIQKGAVVITNQYGGTGVNANVTGNTVTGNGPIGYIAQNGIQVSYGATATVSGNDVSGYDYTGAGWAAIAIPVLSAGTTSVTGNNVHDSMEGMYVEASSNATVSGNTFSNVRDFVLVIWQGSSNGTYTGNRILGMPTSLGLYMADGTDNNVFSGNTFRDNDYGIYVDYSWGTAPTGNVFNLNCIAGNASIGMATAGVVAVPVNAQSNWWGRVDGPAPAGSGDAIDSAATIDASAFLTVPVGDCQPPLVFTTSPSNSTATVAFGTQPVVTIQDAAGNPVTSGPLATSTVSLAITGPNPSGGVLSGTTSVAAVAGVATFSGLSIDKAGTYTLTATDSDPSLGDAVSASFTISVGPPTHLVVAGYTSPTTAGASHGFTVTAKDAGENTVPSYAGTVHFTSTDVGGGTVLPANYTFVPGDAGSHAFAATLSTAGTQSITATDTVNGSINGTQAGIVVDPAAAASLLVAGYPSPSVATVAENFTVTAKDAYGNTDSSYTGTVHFTSSEWSAALPADYAFVAGDAGTRTFTATMNLPVVHSLTATDTVSGITGTQAGIVVTLLDTDNDGCADVYELGLTPPTNGLDPWDFYSVPVPALYAAANPLVVFRDSVVSAGDSQAVFAYFKVAARTGMPVYEQDLNSNGTKDGIEYDRSFAGPGHSGPPDGVVSAADAQMAFAQFKAGYHCNY